MATFSFERILPPGRKSAAIGTARPRGVIVQLLDRLTEARLQRQANELLKAEREIRFTSLAETDATAERGRRR
ncbi:MAG: hypothetical protein J0G95_04715 [Rhizobiales bacterium]|nr:hypothetical protein [Hyphomicrobiales bacterium]